MDTMIASAWLGVRRSQRQIRWAPVLEQAVWVLPFVVVAEMRFGAEVAGWGVRRRAVLKRLVARVGVVPPLADFDQLRGGTQSTFDAASLEELSPVLVKARIARGWTQRQLADALGMAEQQIQRYEANDYRSTSLARLCDIANALGVTVAQHAELRPSAGASMCAVTGTARVSGAARSPWHCSVI